jgi:DNA-binding NtrC family response regulator
MNGIRFLEELWTRRLHGLFPVVVVTATGRWATAIEYGAFEFIQKPFDVGKLKEAVGRALQLKGRSR